MGEPFSSALCFWEKSEQRINERCNDRIFPQHHNHAEQHQHDDHRQEPILFLAEQKMPEFGNGSQFVHEGKLLIHFLIIIFLDFLFLPTAAGFFLPEK